MIAYSPYYDKIMIYALDRILNIMKQDGESFVLPSDFDSEKYFYNYYGIISGTNRKVEKVKLKVVAGQANYLRTVPLHHTQEEIERNNDYSIFTLSISPEFDFYQEILWNAEDMEVLEPNWLRNEIGGIVKRMWNKYKK